MIHFQPPRQTKQNVARQCKRHSSHPRLYRYEQATNNKIARLRYGVVVIIMQLNRTSVGVGLRDLSLLHHVCLYGRVTPLESSILY